MSGSRPKLTSTPAPAPSGQPLPDTLRGFFEPRLGADFASVQIHAAGDAASAAESLDARAFTRGEHVVFASGQYAPETEAGQHLIAHELAHIAQRRSSPSAFDGVLIHRKEATAPPTEKVGTSLWATDPAGKPLPPSLDDIAQGTVADCYLFANLAAIVVTNPQRIVDMIKDNGNGTYTVTFKGIGFWSSATQTVTADFTVGKHAFAGKTGAFWPIVVEKAYAQQKGGIEKIEGKNPGEAMDDLTNVGPSTFDPREEKASWIMGKFAHAKEKKWPATLLSPKKDDASSDKQAIALNTPGLHFWHTYAVIDVDVMKNRIKLFNPWGNDHPNGDGWLDIEVVRKFFIQAAING
jgi:hypothetical protein